MQPTLNNHSPTETRPKPTTKDTVALRLPPLRSAVHVFHAENERAELGQWGVTSLQNSKMMSVG